MKEVVWVFGTSASGKATFINRILVDKKIREKLGWANKIIDVCKESINVLGNTSETAKVNSRKSITKIVPKLLKDSDVVLIKWQYIDSHNQTPEKLEELLPFVRHKIILLKVSPSELIQRLHTKIWWNDSWDDISFVNKEVVKVEGSIKNLSSGFDVTVLNSSKNKNYELIKRLY